ncbi:unnamed protein product [Cochlearia groenlandica]
MSFFDLSLPYSEPPPSRVGKEEAISVVKTTRLKLATKAMELGYVGIAHNRFDQRRDLQQELLHDSFALYRISRQGLSASIFFRRVPPRLTRRLSSHTVSTVHARQGLCREPMNQNAFDYAYEKKSENFRLMHRMVKSAIKAFDATSVVAGKSSKPIDFASVLLMACHRMVSRESGNNLSPGAFEQDHDQATRLESSETELGEETLVPHHNNFEMTMEAETETETNQQAYVKSFETYNIATNSSGKEITKRHRVRLPQLRHFKPFLLQSRFKNE